MRSGFTLVEVLVALVLFELGMLALTGVAAVAARDIASANRLARAHALARNRVETLRPAACSAAASGTTVSGAGTEHWRVQIVGMSRRVSDSVVFRLPGGRTDAVESSTWIHCDR